MASVSILIASSLDLVELLIVYVQWDKSHCPRMAPARNCLNMEEAHLVFACGALSCHQVEGEPMLVSSHKNSKGCTNSVCRIHRICLLLVVQSSTSIEQPSSANAEHR